jgi:GNAT superfamily N-acetyltransferase
MTEAVDRDAVRAFLERLSPSTVKARYLSSWTSFAGPMGDLEVRRLLERSRPDHVVLVARSGGQIRAMGEFAIDPSGHRAELGLVVEDEFQGRGVGRLLYGRLEQVARRRGVSAFTGDIAHGNERMLRLLRRTGRHLHVRPEYGGLRFTLAFENGVVSEAPVRGRRAAA